MPRLVTRRNRAGAGLESFRGDRQDAMLRTFQTSPDAEAMRAFARRVFGAAWATEVLGV